MVSLVWYWNYQKWRFIGQVREHVFPRLSRLSWVQGGRCSYGGGTDKVTEVDECTAAYRGFNILFINDDDIRRAVF